MFSRVAASQDDERPRCVPAVHGSRNPPIRLVARIFPQCCRMRQSANRFTSEGPGNEIRPRTGALSDRWPGVWHRMWCGLWNRRQRNRPRVLRHPDDFPSVRRGGLAVLVERGGHRGRGALHMEHPRWNFARRPCLAPRDGTDYRHAERTGRQFESHPSSQRPHGKNSHGSCSAGRPSTNGSGLPRQFRSHRERSQQRSLYQRRGPIRGVCLEFDELAQSDRPGDIRPTNLHPRSTNQRHGAGIERQLRISDLRRKRAEQRTVDQRRRTVRGVCLASHESLGAGAGGAGGAASVCAGSPERGHEPRVSR